MMIVPPLWQADIRVLEEKHMVRATFAGFSTALSAIQANQKRLDVTGNNLANMNTPGYTRQQLQVSSLNYTRPVSHYMNGSEVVVGFGVHMDKVVQLRDPFLDAQYRGQMQKSAYNDAIQVSLDRLGDIFDESKIDGIRQAFANIQSSLTSIHDLGKVSDPIFESELRSRMQALTNLLNDADRQLTEAEKAEVSRLDGTYTNENGAVQEINDILQQIGTLNRQIKQNQVLGQQSLELMDERNLLLDELASYIPIEVTYYKDQYHDGLVQNDDGTLQTDGNGNPVTNDHEVYHYYNDTRLEKKDWPDDLRVEMVYQDANGNKQKLLLVEGTVGSGHDNYGELILSHPAVQLPDGSTGVPLVTDSAYDVSKIELLFSGVKANYRGEAILNPDVTFSKDNMAGGNGAWRFPDDSGSVQAGLDMLWKDGKTEHMNDVNGYSYYRNELNRLAESFATAMNEINKAGAEDVTQFLLVNKNNNLETGITAGNIGINLNWSNGTVHLGTHGNSTNDTVLNMLEAMQTSFPYSNSSTKFYGPDGNEIDLTGIDLDGNTFADFINHVSTMQANDSYSNSIALKTNVTVLNGIQNSRDSVSGVSLNEEASNMMMYMSAYTAASRLMTTLDEALNVLINNTGLVGR